MKRLPKPIRTFTFERDGITFQGSVLKTSKGYFARWRCLRCFEEGGAGSPSILGIDHAIDDAKTYSLMHDCKLRGSVSDPVSPSIDS